MEQEYDYELLVIGAGSGGISAARKASKLGKKVAICDFVKPSPQGTKWGVGGTCVNVGCIPKKMMHYAALNGELLHDQEASGWHVDTTLKHDWNKMRETVNNYIRSINWGYKKVFIKEKVKYFNALASFVDNHTIKLVKKSGKERTVTADKIVIATGGRPTYLNVEGCREHCITSDDLFWRKQAPGKTLVIGAGYIALECGGFIKGMGHEVAIMVRSVPLRTFDQDMVERIVEKMNDMGCRFLNKCSPDGFYKQENGKILAKWTRKLEDGGTEQLEEEFDTVLLAVGRTPDLSKLNLEAVGVDLSPKGRVIVDKHMKTSADNIFALGDIIVDSPELTPVANREGKYLSEWLFDGKDQTVNYDLIATTIFTPLEYACIGPSEKRAIEIYGEENVTVYHTFFKPLEWNYVKTHKDNLCYVKLITNKIEGDEEHVCALHIACPGAGEIIQGYAVAITIGVTKEQFDQCIKIHPTIAEDILQLDIVKGSEVSPQKTSC